MPLSPDSLLKICRGTRRLGAGRPVLVVTADTMDSQGPLAEFYIFHEFPDMPFLYARATCKHPDDMYLYDFGKYPEIFSAKAMLESQFRAAQDRLEFEISLRNSVASGEGFNSAAPMEYEDTGDLPLIEFAVFQRFTREREQMFKFSRSQALLNLAEKLNQYPEALLQREPKS